MDLQIEGRQTAVRSEWRADIESRVTGLYPGRDITHVRATLTKHDHRKPADSHSVLLVVQIPGHTITAGKHEETFEEAIRLAFEAVGVELEKIREKRASHEVDVNVPPERGIVTKLFPEQGYGFIALEDGTQVYFHKNAVRDAVFEQMDGMEVSLNVEPGEKGSQATVVQPVPPEAHYLDKGAVAA
jgi:cold shock CspA family protein/ribosome-associated translation inhibitor RaiA